MIRPAQFHEVGYHEAIVQCRYWYLKWKRLPKWRFIARHNALIHADVWGQVAKELHAKEQDASEGNPIPRS